MILNIFLTAIGAWISVVLVKFGISYLNTYRLLLRSKCFSGPRAFPLIGSPYFLIDPPEFNKEIERTVVEYESPCRLWVATELYFLVHDPEHVKLVLHDQSTMEKASFYEILRPFFGNGLITAPGIIWKPHRKAIEPLFATKVLESFVPIIAANARAAVKKMGMEERLGNEFDALHYMSRFSFDSICETSMGISLNTTNDTDCPLFTSIERMLEIVPLRFIKPWLKPDFVFNHSALGKELYRHVAVTRDYIRKMVTSAKSELDKESGIRPRKYLARQLLTISEDECKFTDEDIIDHVITIISAGYDTTAKLLSLLLLMLGKYPEMQDKLYAEVRRVCGEIGHADITLQQLSQLEYMDLLIKETLRLFPTAPWLIRHVSNDIKIGKYTLPAGSSVMISVLANHRNEKNFPRPFEFNPDRFLPDHPMGPRHPYAYSPFSLGRRSCIGMKYAMISTKMLLAILISRYVIKTSMVKEPIDFKILLSISTNLVDSPMISIEKRVPGSS